MKFQTLSLVAGTKVCNASCQFCVSKMTGFRDIAGKPEPINERNLRKTLRLAEIGGVTTAIITGKGEPTLYPEHVDTYLKSIAAMSSPIPLVELQTNGELLSREKIRGVNTLDILKGWYELGLTTILVSVVSHKPEVNKASYTPGREYFDLPALIAKIQSVGLNVRLTAVGVMGGIDSPESLDEWMAFAAVNNVKQCTWRPVNKTADDSADSSVNGWVEKHGLDSNAAMQIWNHVKERGTLLYSLLHGAAVFDYRGANLCMTNCLTLEPDTETIRQLIFFPDGKVQTDWQYAGANIL